MKNKQKISIHLLLLAGVFFLVFTSSCEKEDEKNPSSENSDTSQTTTDLTDIDGNKYKTIKYGEQTWMIENLRTTKYNDGTPIPQVKDANAWKILQSPAYCFCNNTNDADSIKNFGAYYNWYVVATEKLAPMGWHVPSQAEWDILRDYLIASGYNYDFTKIGNKIAKSMAVADYWSYSSVTGAIGNGRMSNNSCSFSAFPAGARRNSDGVFVGLFNFTQWWTTNEFDSSIAVIRELWSGDAGLGIAHDIKNKGISVRLIKD